ncbi:hypothetical protein GGS20DRAFT_325694 [Poronia punctata]|nr:hypothetical protein GGS20DRAFT_325694 [Poronia punctata]
MSSANSSSSSSSTPTHSHTHPPSKSSHPKSSKSSSKSKSKSKSTRVHPDPIDALDNTVFGGIPYHHEGPFDATLASRNRDPRTAPVEAVREGNRRALEATPAAHVIDAVTRHVPLQGTAVVPPGGEDYSSGEGNVVVMDYEEGADLMREGDAPGGAYKRWDHVQYHPEDLKGKGEPSFTIERDMKAGKKRKD